MERAVSSLCAAGNRWGRARGRWEPMQFRLVLILCGCLVSGQVVGALGEIAVEIADPYIELHTGPGRGYPVFYVVERGEQITLLKRRTDWFQVRTARGKEGWVYRDQLARTLNPDGSVVAIRDPSWEDFEARRWEMSFSGGEFDGANVIALTAGYALSENLSFELNYSKVLGRFSSLDMTGISILHQPFPEWRVSPFFTLGTGSLRIKPSATLVQPQDRDEDYSNVGIGIKTYLSRRFLMRIEYKSYVVFTNRNENEEPKEWKIGFAFFF